MPKFSHDVIVIGGGSAGLTATAGLAQLGLKTALIEKERLGGDCLYYGCVPSKTLIRSAAANRATLDRALFGLPPVDSPEVRLAEVMERVRAVIATIAAHDSSERFERLGAEVLFGSPRFLSPHELALDRKRISARHIVIATGSLPSELPVPGLAEAGYITNREVFSLSNLPRRLAVIGAGPIGLELSQAFARLGSKVVVLDIAPQVLPKEDADVAATVEARMREEGIEFRLGARIEGVERAADGVRIRYRCTDGDPANTALSLEADRILLAVGRKGSLDGLDLSNAGVAVQRGFIPVDSKLRTTQKNILAIGDCNGKLLFTHVAGAEGSVAVQRLALHLPARMRYDRVPWCTYTDPEIASVGYNEQRAKAENVRYRVVESSFAENDRAQAEGATDGKMKVLIDPRDRIIGVQIVSAAAGELIGPALLAVQGRMRLREMLGVIFPYPTLGEAHQRLAASYYAPKLFNPRVRKILRVLFGYRVIQ